MQVTLPAKLLKAEDGQSNRRAPALASKCVNREANARLLNVLPP
jgi:hypothetical protein